MTDTLNNNLVEAEDYKDIYFLASIASGTDVIVQNVGTTDLYFTISKNKPSRDNEAYRIFRRGEFITANKGDKSIWVFSPQADGFINVEKIFNTELFDLLNRNFLLLSCQLSEIIKALELLNLRTEEMGNTGITKEDVS